MASTLTKSTHRYATHQIPLECDVYAASDYPPAGPVFLWFHSGGLVGGSRLDVPSWLVQTCLQRKWALVSASYRLLPQAGGKELLEDAQAAYSFAQTWGGGGGTRPVIAGGGSAGFFLAALLGHHASPPPLALLSVTGIPSFKHAFFNSSTLIPPEPIKEEDVEPFLVEAVSVGTTPFEPFSLAKLSLPSGTRNAEFDAAAEPPVDRAGQDPDRGMLYDYYLYGNMYEALVGDVDAGFDWTGEAARLAAWPVTIFIQGDNDDDVNMDVCASVAEKLGSRGRWCLAKGQGHLFEMRSFLEDAGPGMDAVRKAVAELDKAVNPKQ